MDIKNIIKELPFDCSGCSNKEELFNAMDKHFSILGLKAEITGDMELTRAIDTMRSLIPSLGKLTNKEKVLWEESNRIIGRYKALFSDDKDIKDERQLLRDDIQCSLDNLQEMWNDFKEKYRAERKYAQKLEQNYREKYGIPSGLWREEAFTNDNCFFDDD